MSYRWRRSTVMTANPPLLYVYAWRRGDDGPYYVGNSTSIEEGISFAEGVLKDCRRGFVRSEIRDSIAGPALWHSAPVLRPR
jgi:hypothetical protein